MSSYDFDWGFVLSSIPTLAGGLVTTLEIAALTERRSQTAVSRRGSAKKPAAATPMGAK
jgi:hypothetical protein